MDYLRRDSYHIGATYGMFDLPRLVHTLTSATTGAEMRICVSSRGKDAVESYRLGRYLMHSQVYHHHARICGDLMFLRAMDMAVADGVLDGGTLRVSADLGADHREFLGHYGGLGDRSVYDLVERNGPRSVYADMLGRIRRRDLLKRAGDFLPHAEIHNAQVRSGVLRMDDAGLGRMSDEMADLAGVRRHDVICSLDMTPVSYYAGDISVMWNGVPRFLDDLSPIKSEEKSVARFYAFCPGDPGVRESVAGYIERKFGIRAGRN